MENTATVGGVMPPGGSIAQSSIDIVRAWITAGAADNRPPAAAAVRIETMFPAPNATLDAAPIQIIAGFDRVVDASTVNAMTFLLEGSGGDGTFGEINDVVINAVPSRYAKTVSLRSPDTLLAAVAAPILPEDRPRDSGLAIDIAEKGVILRAFVKGVFRKYASS